MDIGPIKIIRVTDFEETKYENFNYRWCDYVGTILTEKLLQGMNVTVDTQWFGNYLTKHKNLLILKRILEILTKFSKPLMVIHLANIANDPR